MKRLKLDIILVAVMVAIFAANHFEHHLRAERIRRQAQEWDVPVMQVVSNAAGHSSIQIEERTHRGGYLYFDTLESWAYSKDRPTPCPESVMEANGRQVKLTGFMYPLQDAGSLTVFCLLKSTQTCCYGPRPQYNQYVFVEMPRSVKFERLAPVVVEGRFVVDPKPDEGYIYRMEGKSVRAAVPNDQPPSATDIARRNNLPVFDFAPLEAAKTAADKETEIARMVADLDGKQMVLQGFIVGKTGDAPAKIMIGKYPWDGKAQGTPPGLYNAVLVIPKSADDTPPVWWREAVFTGTVRVTREPAERAKNGIVGLQDAILATAPAGQQGAPVDNGPLVPLAFEFTILTASGGMFFLKWLSKRSNGSISPASPGDRT